MKRKKKLLILVDKIFNKHEVLVWAIQNADPDIRVVLRKISDVEILVSRRSVKVSVLGQDIKNFDMVFFRRVSEMHVIGSIIFYLDRMGIPFIDEGLRKSAVRGDKITSLVRCTYAGVNVVPTYYCSYQRISQNIELIEKKFGYPIIVKKIHEHFMKGVYIIKNRSDFALLKGESKKNRDRRFIFEPFMNFSKEYRFLVLGDSVRVVHTKVARDFREMKVSYLDMNSHEEYLDLKDVTKKMKDIAINSAKALGVQIAGVDMFKEEKTGRVYVLEVNRGPAFNYDAKISPEVPEVAKYIVSKLKGRNIM